jgi:hypothetical protein
VLFALEDPDGPVRSVNVVLAEDAWVSLSELEAVLTGKQPRPPLHLGDPERFGYDYADSRSGRTCAVSVDVRGEESGGGRLVGAVSLIL